MKVAKQKIENEFDPIDLNIIIENKEEQDMLKSLFRKNLSVPASVYVDHKKRQKLQKIMYRIYLTLIE